MDYETVSHFAQIGGLLFFVAAFVTAFGYALRPRNRQKFHDAASTPLRED